MKLLLGRLDEWGWRAVYVISSLLGQPEGDIKSEGSEAYILQAAWPSHCLKVWLRLCKGSPWGFGPPIVNTSQRGYLPSSCVASQSKFLPNFASLVPEVAMG